MENSIQKVWHKQFGSLRMVLLNGTVYCVGKDAAKALLFKDTDKTIRNRVQPQDKIVFDAKKWGDLKSPHGGTVKIANGAILINESGLWSLVMRSRLPKAREFQHWLTSEVIPQIVRTGSYNPAPAPQIVSDFTRREKVEILLKLLNMTPPPALKNHLIKQVSFLLDDEYDNLMEKLNGDLEQIAE